MKIVLGILCVALVGLMIAWFLIRPQSEKTAPDTNDHVAAEQARSDEFSVDGAYNTVRDHRDDDPGRGPNFHSAKERSADETKSRIDPDWPEARAREREAEIAAMPEWQQQLYAIVDTDTNPVQRVQMLYSVMPSMPEEGQYEAVFQITRLATNENYDSVRPVILDKSLPETVLTALLGDLTSRPPEIRRQVLTQIANTPGHPLQEVAAGMLRAEMEAPE